jgi:hypothetical protein
MRTFIAGALALFIANANADDLVIDDPHIVYNYSHETVGPRHFCDFATVMVKPPLIIKLTAAFLTDDTKPKDQDLTVAYMVEAFAVRAGQNSQIESKQVKVTAGRIISDVFNSDLNASKGHDNGLGASYVITSEGAFALFMNTLTIRGKYTLAVEFENQSSLAINVRPTPQIFKPGEDWNKCGLALMQHQTPQ